MAKVMRAVGRENGSAPSLNGSVIPTDQHFTPEKQGYRLPPAPADKHLWFSLAGLGKQNVFT